MERAAEERFERIEANLDATAMGLVAVQQGLVTVQQMLATVTQSQMRLQDMVGGLVESVSRYIAAADARMKQMEANLDALIRIITAEHSNGRGKLEQ